MSSSEATWKTVFCNKDTGIRATGAVPSTAPDSQERYGEEARNAGRAQPYGRLS